jgi:hypothetical protein
MGNPINYNMGDDVGGIRAWAYVVGIDKSFFHLPCMFAY